FAAALVLAVILLAAFTSVLSAVDYEDFGEEYQEMLDGIPEDIRELLPDGIFSENPEEIYGAVSEISGFPYILRTVASLAGVRLGSALRLFALLLGLLVLSALLRSVRELVKSPALSQAVSLCSISATLAAAVSVQYEMLSAVSRFLDQLNLLVNSMIPIMGALYAMGGNVSAAVTNNSAMMVFLAVTENICNRTVIPVTAFCLALSLVSVFAPAIDMRGLATTIKKIFTFIIAFVMTLLGTVLAMQSTLTAAGDSVAARAAKFMAGNFIPVVGGSVGDSLKTVAGSIEYIRACVGVGGIIIIVLLLLPTILSIVATRLAFMAAGTVSKLLGCSEESNLLGELTQIYGYLLAVVSSCSVLFIFALTLLARTSAAIG
ncbi:MAG TPA: hypothetical protein PKN17_03300, partial [Bacillota bacterium]|nr:hypothetical protein [Bacillota bacterium]